MPDFRVDADCPFIQKVGEKIMKLTIDKVTKSYGSNKALDMFSAELEAGIYALL